MRRQQDIKDRGPELIGWNAGDAESRGCGMKGGRWRAARERPPVLRAGLMARQLLARHVEEER